MNISLSWLKDWLPGLNQSAEETGALLTSIGLELEHIALHAKTGGSLDNVVIGHVLSVTQHPNADRLRLCQVQTAPAAEAVQIVCGAANVAEGQKVLVALPGARLTTARGEKLDIKKGKIRGEESLGMICAEDELGLGHSHEGIMVLPPDAPLGQAAQSYMGLEPEAILEIGLTPNRGDAASHFGVARDLAAKLDLPSPTLPAGAKTGQGSISVSIEHAPDCVVYACQVFESIQVGPSPEWLRQRLNSIGVVSINNVVDITNYVCHHLGQPMHAFDADTLQGSSLAVTKAQAGQKLALLDKREVTLDAQDLVIADAYGPVALAGAVGGSATAVSEQTTRIVLESACFNPTAVRKTAARHGVKTDSSFRFERGVDPDLALRALSLAGILLAEIAEAKAEGTASAVNGQVLEAKQIAVPFRRLYSLIGQPVGDERVEQMLRSLGFGISSLADEPGLLATVPSHRLYDVEGLADIAEEVVRLYGLNNLALPERTRVPFMDTAPGWQRPDAEAKAGRYLAAQGWLELVTNSLEPSGQTAGLAEGEKAVHMLNPLSEELAQMRTSPLTAGLAAIAYNANRRQRLARFFEFGRTYAQDLESGSYRERPYLTFWLWGQPDDHWQGSQPVRFADLLSVVTGMLDTLSISVQMESGPADAHFSQALALKTRGGKLLGTGGPILPALLKAADLKGPAYALHLGWSAVLKAQDLRDFLATEPPRHPAVRRDLSLVLDEATSYTQLEAAALKAERKLLREVSLFDIFRGKGLAEGKKSYALSFTLADPEATLNDKQIDQAMSRIEAALTVLGAEVRR